MIPDLFPNDNNDNIEYQAMIAALDKLVRESSEEMKDIEEANGIGGLMNLENDEITARTKLNILDVFGIEINN